MCTKKKNPQYTVKMMKAACDYGLLNSFTIRGSAKLHGVPESTLRRRLGDSRAAEEWKMGAPIIFYNFWRIPACTTLRWYGR